MTLKRKPVDLPTITVEYADGPLAGHTVIMRSVSTRLYLLIRSDEITNDDCVRETLAAVVDHSLDLPGGVGDLPVGQVVDLFGRWIAAWEESALPPASGPSTETP